MNNRHVRLAALALCCLLLAAAMPARAALAAAKLEKGQRLALVVPEQLTPSATMARDDLLSFLQRSMSVVVRYYPPTVQLSGIDEPLACIVFGTPKSNPLLARLSSGEFGATTNGLGKEGLHIKAGAVDGKLVVALAGETETGASYAAYSFLENEIGVGFFIDGDRIPHPDAVELTNLDRVEKPTVPHRGLFHHFIWKHPYANCWRLWGLDHWKKSIDWMRHKRFNLLPMVHDEGGYFWGDVVFNTFPEIPINDHTLSQFVVDPRWRRELTAKTIDYARQSGIHIAYNLFYSQVPEFFADSHPELKYHELSMRNVGINADQPQCQDIMRKYWRGILDTFGRDDEHIYFVCSYRHEHVLGEGTEGFKNKNQTTLDACKVLKELDPQAEIYIETWCWKYRDEKERTGKTLDDNPMLEWRDFDPVIPRDIGVVEWDVRRMHPDSLPPSFNGRPWMQLTHSNMEEWWPPNTIRNHPQWLIDYFGNAIDNGARGILFFHIQANTHEILADLAAKLGWELRPDLKEFYQDYVRRRFGSSAVDLLAESQALLADAVNFGANAETAPLRGMLQPLAPPGYRTSAERYLAETKETGEEKKKWIRDRLKVFRAKAKLAAEATRLARSAAATLKDEPFLAKYLWELDYVAVRYEGIENMYMAHLVADTDPQKAQTHFQRAVDAFQAVKELFRNQREIRMSEIRELEPDVPYTAAFLKDWETRGSWEPIVRSFHVVWERFDEFEQKIRDMRPKELPSQN